MNLRNGSSSPTRPFIGSHDRDRFAETKEPREPYIGGSISRVGGRTSAGVGVNWQSRPPRIVNRPSHLLLSSFGTAVPFSELATSPGDYTDLLSLDGGKKKIAVKIVWRRARIRDAFGRALIRARQRTHARTLAGRPAARSSCAHIRGVWWACPSGRRKRSASRSNVFPLDNKRLLDRNLKPTFDPERKRNDGGCRYRDIVRQWRPIKFEIEDAPPCI